jgi:hypothetical protein
MKSLRTVSLIAIVPDSECKMPILMGGNAAAAPLEGALGPSATAASVLACDLLQPGNSAAHSANAPSDSRREIFIGVLLALNVKAAHRITEIHRLKVRRSQSRLCECDVSELQPPPPAATDAFDPRQSANSAAALPLPALFPEPLFKLGRNSQHHVELPVGDAVTALSCRGWVHG